MSEDTPIWKKYPEQVLKRLRKVSAMRIIPVVFGLIIFVGAFLLMLPVSSRAGNWTDFTDALFTATSATCVTGLIRFDTYTYWSTFGQIVILCMIQIGGIGFMSIAVSFMALTGHKIGLSSRMLMQNSISAPQVGGMVKITRFLTLGTFLIEGIGALLLSFIFVPKYGPGKGMYFSLFHSISAFCNAGFDLMGTEEQFSSLTTMGDNWYLNLVIMLLIIIGGLGFFVWKDMIETKFLFKKMKLHTKIVLTISTILILTGFAVFFFMELGEPGTEGVSIPNQLLHALFQSVTTRTAGFNSIDLTKMTEGSRFLMIVLMLIGGSPGSTAGGMKTTTFAVITISIYSVYKRKKSEEAFGRRMDEDIMRSATCVLMTYLILSCGTAILISKLESIPILTALFETASALGTVGLSLNLTPQVGMVSKIILAMLMFIGRVGSVTIMMGFSSPRKMSPSKLPLEKVQIG